MLDDFESYNQSISLQPFITKLKNNELTLENILEEDEIINDIKYNTESEFINFITDDKLKKLIDYSTKIPKSTEHNIGFKYPFNATEILSAENIKFQNKFLIQKPFISKESQLRKFKSKLNKAKKIKKNGFIFNFFKILKKVKNSDIYEDNVELDFEEINEDDFSEEEIIEFEKSKDTEAKMVYDNIDYLLNFLLDKDGAQENYVLIGYFYKILNTIINMHGVKIIQYLYDFPKKDELDILNIFVNHMDRKSMCDIVRKLLTFEDDLMSKYEQKKLNLFEKILDELNKCDDNDKCDCICDSLYLVMNSTEFFNLFMIKNDLLKKVYNIYFDCKNNKNNKKRISILKLLIKINENILQRFEVHFTENPINNNTEINEFLYGTSFSKENNALSQTDNKEILITFLNYLFEILEKNQFNDFFDFDIYEQEFTATYMKKQKKIGLLKIKQTEYISTLIEIFVNASGSKYHENKIDILINKMNEKGIFWNLHDIFFSYIFSNIYQILYKKIIEIVINEHSPKILVDSFFFEKVNKKRNLINLYIEKEISNEMKLYHSSKNVYTLNPCFAFINSIIYQIYTSQNNEIRKILEENNDIHIFVEIMVEEFENFFQYKLLYQDPLDALCSNSTAEPSPFGDKSIYEIFEENCMIYNKYKKGEDYKILLKEKKERTESEKEENDDENEKNKENEITDDNKGIKYIDDLEDELGEGNKLLKEKIDLKKDRDNFLEMLNKPTSEINKEINEDENDNENGEYHGRFNIDNLDEEDEKDENDKKINDNKTSDLKENEIYNTDNNKINDKDNNTE